MKKVLDESLLAKLGVEIAYHQEWVGEPPNRHPETRSDVITDVKIPFSPKTWWRISSRDGDHYIGPCCGVTGAMQDIICGVYRDSGHMTSCDLIRLAELASQHEGFEAWHKKISQKAFEEKLASWKTLSPWDQIGLIYQGTKAKLRDGDFRGTVPWKQHTPDVKTAMRDLEHGIRFLSYHDMFTRDEKRPDAEKSQDHAYRLLLLSRVIPACNLVYAALSKMDEVFTGFAVSTKDKPDEVLSNGLGMCIYEKQEHVDELIELWEKSEKDLRDKLLVRPIRISAKDGMTLG